MPNTPKNQNDPYLCFNPFNLNLSKHHHKSLIFVFLHLENVLLLFRNIIYEQSTV